MRKFILESYELVMDSRKNPLHHLDLASQHQVMQALAWMWSMVFSLSFLSIFYFHYVWAAHLLILGGIFFTVGVFRHAAKQEHEQFTAPAAAVPSHDDPHTNYSHASACTWRLDSEA
ncbi:hypothetical protein [Litorivivens sp.]|uniref:hypothetical protein n=1 Tax=Litorivivens sp. TaxID=2020868 RepID=UPI00356A7455